MNYLSNIKQKSKLKTLQAENKASMAFLNHVIDGVKIRYAQKDQLNKPSIILRGPLPQRFIPIYQLGLRL